ncbi:hypothetical protein [Porphyromonas levii]|uniref:Uncharacterized protein n=1 Tax=Porphyromonas levii TaxID=28114 RepID=A0A4Y8WT03_9PORP|nr:hypothetical protein [Porphyromonas levii]TFH96871.1 hypothetical protein E4P47_01565 [Porphyromonas levii]TFH97614.1 hypothetical protein E4P48_00850 [Porphyromonas levii]
MHGGEIQGAEDEDDGSVLGYVTKPKCQQLQRGWLLGYSFQLVSYVSLPHTERNTSGSAYYFMRPTIVTNFSKGGKISFQRWKGKFPALERLLSTIGKCWESWDYTQALPLRQLWHHKSSTQCSSRIAWADDA